MGSDGIYSTRENSFFVGFYGNSTALFSSGLVITIQVKAKEIRFHPNYIHKYT